jgi:hypothetical protein
VNFAPMVFLRVLCGGAHRFSDYARCRAITAISGSHHSYRPYRLLSHVAIPIKVMTSMTTRAAVMR